MAEPFDLSDPKHIGRSEYTIVLDWLRMMVANHERDDPGEAFTKEEAIDSLLELRREIEGVIVLLGGPDLNIIWRMHAVATTGESACIDDLSLRAGLTWNCLGGEDGITHWTNSETDTICGECGKPRPPKERA